MRSVRHLQKAYIAESVYWIYCEKILRDAKQDPSTEKKRYKFVASLNIEVKFISMTF